MPPHNDGPDAAVTSASGRLVHRAFPWGAVLERPGVAPVLTMHLDAIADPADPAAPGMVELRIADEPGGALGRCAIADLHAAAGSGRVHLGDRTLRRPEPEDAALLTEPFLTLIGWQSKSDASWVARMRLHQSWYRTFRLRLPFGTGPNEPSPSEQDSDAKGPSDESAGKYGNMLTAVPAAEGRNFTSMVAYHQYRTRVDDGRPGVDPWRTTRNLLASQPMAFNLFGPLVDDRARELATAVLRSIVPDVHEVTHGEIERPSDALGDRTAFDVYFEYRRSDGTTACIAVETKLTEKFSQRAYDWDHYLASPGFDSAVWTTADPSTLGNLRWSQLWRNHLLARAESTRYRHGEPTVLVVHHPQDLACVKTVNGYRQLLRDRDRCRSVDIGTVLDAVRMASEPTGVPSWVEDFADRYLRLGLSAQLTKLHGVRYEDDARRAGMV